MLTRSPPPKNRGGWRVLKDKGSRGDFIHVHQEEALRWLILSEEEDPIGYRQFASRRAHLQAQLAVLDQEAEPAAIVGISFTAGRFTAPREYLPNSRPRQWTHSRTR
jgi:hypothetical protein